jgi:hypothetical protein
MVPPEVSGPLLHSLLASPLSLGGQSLIDVRTAAVHDCGNGSPNGLNPLSSLNLIGGKLLAASRQDHPNSMDVAPGRPTDRGFQGLERMKHAACSHDCNVHSTFRSVCPHQGDIEHNVARETTSDRVGTGSSPPLR